MKIGFFELEGWEEPTIRTNFPDAEIVLSNDKIDELSIPAATDFDIISVFVDSRITKDVLARFPNLKLIATRSTGYDHIDIAACGERGIKVAYVPGYGDNTVAEFAFGLLLSLIRKIYKGIDQIKETGSFSLEGMRGTDLKGKIIGIVGTGRIGKEIVKIAKGFGMQVIAFDPLPDIAYASAMAFKYVSTLEELLGNSDVITIHCPLTPATTHLINENNIKSIKRGAYLINTARGGIVSTEALAAALNDGILAGAAVDVLEEEGELQEELTFLSKGHPKESELRTLLQNHILMKMPNVLITPHMAFDSTEALERILNTTFANIKNFIAGMPFNIVKN
jgi:D-lactate dehydrogenase